MKKKTKILVALLAVCLALTILPLVAMAGAPTNVSVATATELATEIGKGGAQVITVTADLTVDQISLPTGSDITIKGDIPTRVITRGSGSTPVFRMQDVTAALTLQDITIQGDGANHIEALITYYTGSTLNLGSGAKLLNGSGSYGSAIYCAGGVLNMNGGSEISGCVGNTIDAGGSATINLRGGKIENNGNALVATANTTINISQAAVITDPIVLAKGAKIVAADDLSANSYAINVASDAAAGDVIIEGAGADATKISIGNGATWGAVKVGNAIKLAPKVVYIFNQTITAQDGTLSKPYQDMQSAYNAVADGGEIRLLYHYEQATPIRANQAKNVTITSKYRLNDSMTLDPNWHGAWTITRANTLTSEAVLDVTAGKVTLQNITLDGNKAAVNSVNPSTSAGDTRPLVRVSSQFNLGTGATLQNNHGGKAYGGNSAGAIFIADSGTVTMENGATIQGNVSASYAGAILVGNSGSNSARFIMNGGTISGNAAAEQLGNAVCIWGGTADIKGGSIINNFGAAAGAIAIDSGGTINLSGAPVIKNNIHTAAGIDSPSNVVISTNYPITLGDLSSGAEIGISALAAAPVVVATSALSTDLPYFTADNSQQAVIFAGTALKLVSAPNTYVKAGGNGDGSFARPFGTLQDAYTKLSGGGEIRLLSNLTLNQTTKFEAAKNITLISCDPSTGKPVSTLAKRHTLTRNMANSALLAAAGQTTLKNVIITDAPNLKGQESPIVLKDTAQLTLEAGATIINTKSLFSAIYVFGGNLEMKAGALISGHTNIGENPNLAETPTQGAGGAITLGSAGTTAGNLTISGGKITANTAPIGGGVYVINGAVTVSDTAKIIGNTNKAGDASNVYLGTGQKVLLGGALQAEAAIGVDTQATTLPIDIAMKGSSNVVSGDAAHFFADNVAEAIVKFVDDANDENDKLILQALMPNVYVSNAGDDSTGDGTTAQPYATLNKAYQEVVNNGTIHVMNDLTINSAATSFDANVKKAVTIASCKDTGANWANSGDTHKLTRQWSQCLFTIDAGTITLKNITITDATTGYNNSPVCINKNGAKLVLDTGATFTGTESEFSAIYVFGGTVEMKTGSKITLHKNNGTYPGNTNSTPTTGAAGGITLGSAGSTLGHLIMSGGEITANTAAVGGGVYVINGDISVSGTAKITANLTTGGAPSNVYLHTNQTIKVADRLSAPANIGINTKTKPEDGKPIKIATGATAADVSYFKADDMGRAGVRLAGSSEPAGALYLDTANRAVAQINLADGSNVLYSTFDQAIAAVAADATGDLDDNNATPSHYTVELLANATTVGGWGNKGITVTAPTVDGTVNGAPKYALTITGLVASQGGPAVIENLKLIASDGSERMHVYQNLTVKNCTLGSFAIADRGAGRGLVTMESGSINGNVRFATDDTGNATKNKPFAIKSGAVSVNGKIMFLQKGDYLTLLAGSTAGERYNITLPAGATYSGGEKIVEGSDAGFTATTIKPLARNIKIDDGTQWLAVGNADGDIILKEVQAYYVSQTGDDTKGDGTFAKPYQTMQKAYDEGVANSEQGINIRVLSNLEAASANFTAANIEAVSSIVIESYRDKDNKAATPWKIANAATLLNITGGNVVLQNIVLTSTDPTADTKQNIITVSGADSSLILNAGAKITDYQCVNGQWGNILVEDGALITMNEQAEIANLTSNTGNIRIVNAKFIMNGGKISHLVAGDSNQEGTAIYISTGGSFTMHNGLITGCNLNPRTQANGTIYLHGTGINHFVMDGGVITGNTATYGGGLYSNNNANTMTIAGTAKIHNNLTASGAASNVWLKNGQIMEIGGDGLHSGAQIGVMVENPPTKAGATVAIAKNAVLGDNQYFSSDKTTAAGIIYKDAQVLLSYDNRYIPSGGGGTSTKPVPPVKIPVDPTKTGVAKLLNTVDHKAYMKGLEGGLFAPKSGITRAETAQMFYNLLKNQDINSDRSFSDVAAGNWYTTAVKALAELGIIEGYTDGTFKPNQKISRAEFTALAMRFANQVAGTAHFSDVTASNWAYDEISAATQYGWIMGYTDGTFKPNGNITRAEAATVVNAMLGRIADQAAIDAASNLKNFSDVVTANWAYYEIMEATNTHDYTKDAKGLESWK